MNNLPENEKIMKLKNELQMAEKANGICDTLHNKREELESFITTIRNQIDHETLQLHKKRLNQEEELSELIKRIDEKKDLLSKVQKTKQDMDAQLDDYESFSDEIIETLRQSLVNTLLESHPEKRVTYEKLDQQLKDKQNLHKALLAIETDVEQVIGHLNIVLEERARVKRNNFFSYIFGTNPNITITMSLQSANQLIEVGKAQLQIALTSAHSKERIDLLQELEKTFLSIQHETQKRWGFKKIDTLIAPLHERLTELFERLKRETDITGKQTMELDAQLSRWIDKL